jgi:hypothetical protein
VGSWRERFAPLPLNCARNLSPGIDEVEEWREWSNRPTTEDQLRIEEYVDDLDLDGSSILHVGIGNSQFAARFARRAAQIVGLTISPLEFQQGLGLGLGNYQPLVQNKYALHPEILQTSFDIIIDNNPSTFACCGRHFMNMLEQYALRLRPKGMILTDKLGLGWVVSSPESDPRWRFNFEDWALLGAQVGLKATPVTDHVYALASPATKIPRPNGL